MSLMRALTREEPWLELMVLITSPTVVADWEMVMVRLLPWESMRRNCPEPMPRPPLRPLRSVEVPMYLCWAETPEMVLAEDSSAKRPRAWGAGAVDGEGAGADGGVGENDAAAVVAEGQLNSVTGVGLDLCEGVGDRRVSVDGQVVLGAVARDHMERAVSGAGAAVDVF